MNDLSSITNRGTLKRNPGERRAATLQDVVIVYAGGHRHAGRTAAEENYVNKIYPQSSPGGCGRRFSDDGRRLTRSWTSCSSPGGTVASWRRSIPG